MRAADKRTHGGHATTAGPGWGRWALPTVRLWMEAVDTAAASAVAGGQRWLRP